MITEEFEDIVRKRLEKLYEEDAASADMPSPDDPQNETDANMQQDGEENDEDDFSAESLDDFLTKTNTKVTVKKEGCMPSPIFGNRDSNNHNKYRVYVSNEKGKLSFVFWDSIVNTKKGKELDTEEALAAFGKDISAYEEAPSFEEFKSAFGYDETEVSIAQKAFNGCRAQMEKAKKIFTKKQIEELCRLASEK